MFICPNCQKTLRTTPSVWRCENGHAFDVAKQGDINLLLPQQKRSKSPGDSKAMVVARHDFLACGVYQPIAEMLSKYVTILSQGMPCTIADAGCGEGYYLRHIQRLCYPNVHSGAVFVGWDISKFAVQAAAKATDRQLPITWLTASNAAIPLYNNSVNMVLNIFGFAVDKEFARILNRQAGQGGYIICVDAGAQHLIELRRLIYPVIKPYQIKKPLSEAYFVQRKQSSMTYEITLNAEQLQQLLLMTPHLYRANAAGKEKIAALTELTVTVDVVLRVYQVKSDTT